MTDLIKDWAINLLRAKTEGFVRTFKVASLTFFTLQYVYYLLEMLLSGLIISLSQQAITDYSGKQSMFPWGGLVLGLTWGLGHYVSKGDIYMAVIAFVLAIFFGLIYNLTGRDLKKAWPLMYLVFACIGWRIFPVFPRHRRLAYLCGKPTGFLMILTINGPA